MRWSFPLERSTVGEIAIEIKRILRPPYERLVVDVDKPEALAVAERPLEIVEQRPHEITAHRDSGFDCVEHRSEIVAQIGDTLPVANSLVRLDPVGKGSAVFENVDRQITGVALLGLDQYRTKSVGYDLPAHLGHGRSPGWRQDANLEGVVGIAAHSGSGVMVNGEIIRLAPDDVEIARLHQRLHLGGERLGIMPVDLRLGKGAVPQRIEHSRGDLVLLAIACRLPGMEIVDIADQYFVMLRPHRGDLQPVAARRHVDLARARESAPDA